MRLGNDSRTLTLTQWHSYPYTAIGRHNYCSVPYRAQLSEVLGLSQVAAATCSSLQQPAAAYSSLQQPAAACSSLQQPAAACSSEQQRTAANTSLEVKDPRYPLPAGAIWEQVGGLVVVWVSM